MSRLASLFVGVLIAGCSSDPSDDPADWDVDPSVDWKLIVSEPRWVVPSSALPSEVKLMPSNNNLDLTYHEGRLFFAWRTAPTHFASSEARIEVVSSGDDGETFVYETSVALGADAREPRLISIDDELYFYYFEAGTEFASFRPKQIWRQKRISEGEWSPKEPYGERGEVHWDVKVRGELAYMTSYLGNHYGTGTVSVDLRFVKTQDGENWTPVGRNGPTVYRGGVSEAAFELDEGGNLWAVTRNEDGDATGFGSHVCTAPASDLGAWECSVKCDPERYDSPEMFRHGDDLFLVGRRDVGGPYDAGLELPLAEARLRYQASYWGRPKRTAIYELDRVARKVRHLLDLPSAGDTSFAEVVRTGAHTFLLANYTSPLDDPDISWIEGQGSDRGTQIYFVTLTFTE
ncbi:MAG: hypothetical protein HY791_00325 [Deltaproteobacteria bacterium]|nr:hypothetical protein [Deltaproteobacteria bacterium]